MYRAIFAGREMFWQWCQVCFVLDQSAADDRGNARRAASYFMPLHRRHYDGNPISGSTNLIPMKSVKDRDANAAQSIKDVVVEWFSTEDLTKTVQMNGDVMSLLAWPTGVALSIVGMVLAVSLLRRPRI